LTKKIHTVIVTYNAEKWLNTSIESALKSDCPVEIVVVDNASVDNTVEHIIKDYPEVKLIRLKKNIGFGQANNKGISYALNSGAENVFLLNQDAEVEPDTIRILAEFQNDHPEYGICSPIHLNGEGTNFDLKFARYGLKSGVGGRLTFEEWSDCRKKDANLNSLKSVYQVHYVNAAAWMLSRPCLYQIGGFHPIFFMYGEDDEYLNRMKNENYLAGVVPSAVIRHHREQVIVNELERTPKQQEEHYIRSVKLLLTNEKLSFSERNLGVCKHLFKGFRKKILKQPIQVLTFFFKHISRYHAICRELRKIPPRTTPFSYLNVNDKLK
jgi:GT2 family glycosyltransferase